jgi:cytochrome c553
MSKLPSRPILILAILSMCTGAWAATDERQLSYGKHLAQECATCHRIDGIDNGIPSIVGHSPSQFVQTITYYRNGERTNQAMVSVAQSLDDEQVAALAAYYASLPRLGVKK